MAPQGSDVLPLGPSPWPGHGRPDARPEATPLFAYLLDADEDLAQELDVRMRLTARQRATARVLEAEVGACDLEPSLVAVAHGPGLLVLAGLLAVETRVADRTVTELVGGGDLLQPDALAADELIERVASWRTLRPSRFAVLDADFAERIRPWPQISQALLRRAERRADELALLRAITSQPRLEVRLVLLLWHLATRWGRVEPSGLHLTLPLTHRLLGQLVSAERPSITHALRRLGDAELVTGSTGDWHLHGNLHEHLTALIERPSTLATQTSGRQSAGA
jgi:CRP-like cAMP-binding protein